MTVWSCSNDSEENLFPELELCDTVDMSYANDILPVIINNCYACHSSESNSSGILLEGHENFSEIARTGSLLGAIKHESDYTPMPLSSSKLDTCSINKIEAWINQGSKNN